MIQLSFIEVNGRLLFKEPPYCGQRVNPKFHQYNHSFGIFWQSGSILAQATKLFSITWTHPVMPVKVWTEESQQSRLGSASSAAQKTCFKKATKQKETAEQPARNNQVYVKAQSGLEGCYTIKLHWYYGLWIQQKQQDSCQLHWGSAQPHQSCHSHGCFLPLHRAQCTTHKADAQAAWVLAVSRAWHTF